MTFTDKEIKCKSLPILRRLTIRVRLRLPYSIAAEGDFAIFKRLHVSRPSSAAFLHQTHAISRGDVIGCRGYPLRMRRGELSIMARELTLLSPCMKLIPKIWHGLEDVDKRYRCVANGD